MRKLSPPIHLLRAFSTTVRCGGISRAAEALSLTQSAVSKQIQELERWVGVPLFERVRKRLVTTPAGQRYESQVRLLLAQLEASTLELITSRDGGGALNLSTLPTFGAKWLIPRLPRFQSAHPNIALNFVPCVDGYDFSRPDLDCSILFGDGHWTGTTAHYLTGRQVMLIAPPARSGEPWLKTPQDISRFTLLQHATVPHAWQHWCEAHRVQEVKALAGPRLDQFHSLIRAVMAGMGLALIPECLVADDLAQGLVSAPLKDGYTDKMGYWLCYPEARAQLEPLLRFRQWLSEEVAEADMKAASA